MTTQKSTLIFKRERLACLFGACVLAGAPPALAAEGAAAPAVSPQAAAPVEQGGMRIYLDPVTGEILPGPPPGRPALPLSPAEANAMSTSSAGLVEIPSPLPGGGIMLDLQGRFQSPLIATTGPDGKITLKHAGEAPAASHDHD